MLLKKKLALIGINKAVVCQLLLDEIKKLLFMSYLLEGLTVYKSCKTSMCINHVRPHCVYISQDLTVCICYK